jgi:hypothetical protein
MGLFHSKVDDKSRMEANHKKQRERELWLGGILVPPLFGIPLPLPSSSSSSSSSSAPSIAINTSSTNAANSLSSSRCAPVLLGYVDSFRTQTDLSYLLLNNHMQSGLWISNNTTGTGTTTSNGDRIHYGLSPQTKLRVGIFDSNSNNNKIKVNQSIPLSQQSSPTGSTSDIGEDVMSSNASLDDVSQYERYNSKRINPAAQHIGGQVTVERQFLNDKGEVYGSIQLHTDPTNPQLPYSIHVTHRPRPCISLFGTYLSPTSQGVLPSKHQSTTTTAPIHGYIGGEIEQTLPVLWSSTTNNGKQNQHHEDHSRNRKSDGTPYVVTTNTNSDNGLHVKVGAYVPIHWNQVYESDRHLYGTTDQTRSLPYVMPYNPNTRFVTNNLQTSLFNVVLGAKEVTGCVAVHGLGITAALQGSMPLKDRQQRRRDGTQIYTTSSYFTTNISDESTNQSPIQLTIQQQNEFGTTSLSSNSSISISQIITFQRYHFNIEEYRAPYIHNTLAWTIQMESLSSSSSSSLSKPSFISAAEDSGEHHLPGTSDVLNRTNRVSLGLAWQLNRNVAVKAVLYPQPQSSSLSLHDKSPSSNITATTAILFKRWFYPRITCSLLHKWEYNPSSVSLPKPRFAGVGIDIETGDDTVHVPSMVSRRDTDTKDGSTQTPPTIAVTPKELYYKLKRP